MCWRWTWLLLKGGFIEGEEGGRLGEKIVNKG